MNIKQETLNKFLKAVKMDGGAVVEECVADFKEDGLHIQALTSSQTVFMRGMLDKSVFGNYEAIGEVPIKSLRELHIIINRFGRKDEIKLDVQTPYLVLDAGKVFKMKLVNRDVIEDLPACPEISGSNILKISKDKLAEFVKDLNAIEATTFNVVIEPKKATFSGDEIHKCIAVFESGTLTDNMKVEFGEPLMNALGGVDGDVSMTFQQSDFPIKIQYKTDNYNVVYVVAPMSGPEEGEKKEGPKEEEPEETKEE